jgi:uncharacterized membrane protein YfcA
VVVVLIIIIAIVLYFTLRKKDDKVTTTTTSSTTGLASLNLGNIIGGISGMLNSEDEPVNQLPGGAKA